jgi:dGTPase
MDNSSLCNALKKLAQQYAFSNSSVLRMEALGASALDGLLTFYWNAISSRESFDDLLSKRGTAVNKYVFALVSQPNYLEDAIRSAEPDGVACSIRYRELRLLTDMISGMTDTFAIKLWGDLKGLR